MSYAIRKDGQGWRAVNGPGDVGPDEDYSEAQPVLVSSASDEIKRQIIELEVQQNERRIREAVLGVDNGWLANLNAQIEALRSQLI